MKKIIKVLFSFLLVALFATGCVQGNTSSSSASSSASSSTNEFVDYVSNFKLDMNSSRKRIEATVHSYIDGDTVHFNANDPAFDKGIAKARFLGVNTPESTGQVEPWGKAASNFTKETLKEAKSIILESEASEWEVDSTGERHLLWIWYKTETSDYRLLNLELLQEGYSIANNIGKYAYKDVLQSAFNQALKSNLRVNGSAKDPNYDYGRPSQVTLRYVRENLAEHGYEGEGTIIDKRISFEALVTYVAGNTIYVEDYDEETEMSYGMPIFLGMSPTSAVLNVAKVGNIADFCGVITYSENFGVQVSDIKIMPFDPTYKYNTNLISSNNPVVATEITGETLINDGSKIQGTFVSMKNLVVTNTYTTKDGDSKGAITITCKTEDNKTITVRTSVLTDENDEIVKETVFKGKTIDVIGIVDYYNNAYQVAVHIYSNIDIH